MTAIALSPDGPPPSPRADRAPLVYWLIFTGVTIFAAALVWRYGLFRLMFEFDRTHISAAIVVLYVCASLHCLWRTVVIFREADAGRRAASQIVGGPNLVMERFEDLPPGLVADHIRDLALKAPQHGAGELDQTLLLRGLADRLRGSNGFGSFASDTLMKLGLLGTIIGFIMMLAPIAGLDADDRGALMKSSMA